MPRRRSGSRGFPRSLVPGPIENPARALDGDASGDRGVGGGKISAEHLDAAGDAAGVERAILAGRHRDVPLERPDVAAVAAAARRWRDPRDTDDVEHQHLLYRCPDAVLSGDRDRVQSARRGGALNGERTRSEAVRVQVAGRQTGRQAGHREVHAVPAVGAGRRQCSLGDHMSGDAGEAISGDGKRAWRSDEHGRFVRAGETRSLVDVQRQRLRRQFPSAGVAGQCHGVLTAGSRGSHSGDAGGVAGYKGQSLGQHLILVEADRPHVRRDRDRTRAADAERGAVRAGELHPAHHGYREHRSDAARAERGRHRGGREGTGRSQRGSANERGGAGPVVLQTEPGCVRVREEAPRYGCRRTARGQQHPILDARGKGRPYRRHDARWRRRSQVDGERLLGRSIYIGGGDAARARGAGAEVRLETLVFARERGHSGNRGGSVAVVGEGQPGDERQRIDGEPGRREAGGGHEEVHRGAGGPGEGTGEVICRLLWTLTV